MEGKNHFSSEIKRLSIYDDQGSSNWLRLHSGRIITHFQLREIFVHAYIQAEIMYMATNYHQKNFTDSDFLDVSKTLVQLTNDELEIAYLAAEIQ